MLNGHRSGSSWK